MKTATRNLINIIRSSRESNTVCNSSQETITGERCHKYHFCRDNVFCRDKSMFVVTKVLSRNNYVCRVKTFLTTTICRNKHNFVATSMFLSRQKTCFVVTNTCLLRQKCYLRQLPPMIGDEARTRFSEIAATLPYLALPCLPFLKGLMKYLKLEKLNPIPAHK